MSWGELHNGYSSLLGMWPFGALKITAGIFFSCFEVSFFFFVKPFVFLSERNLDFTNSLVHV